MDCVEETNRQLALKRSFFILKNESPLDWWQKGEKHHHEMLRIECVAWHDVANFQEARWKRTWIGYRAHIVLHYCTVYLIWYCNVLLFCPRYSNRIMYTDPVEASAMGIVKPSRGDSVNRMSKSKSHTHKHTHKRATRISSQMYFEFLIFH